MFGSWGKSEDKRNTLNYIVQIRIQQIHEKCEKGKVSLIGGIKKGFIILWGNI